MYVCIYTCTHMKIWAPICYVTRIHVSLGVRYIYNLYMGMYIYIEMYIYGACVFGGGCIVYSHMHTPICLAFTVRCFSSWLTCSFFDPRSLNLTQYSFSPSYRFCLSVEARMCTHKTVFTDLLAVVGIATGCGSKPEPRNI